MKVKFVLLAAVVTAVTGMVAMPAQADAVTSGDNSAGRSDYKGFDNDPHLQLSPAQAKGEAAKFARAKELVAFGGLKRGSATPSSAPASYSLGGRQQAQTTSYWCGPAAVSEALSHLGVSLSQSTMASQLKTDTSGTAWSGVYVSTSPSTGFPVADVLTNRLGDSYYSVAVGSPTSTDINNLQVRVQSSIYYFGDPVVNDAWETATSTYHLVGHPRDRTIFHWFTTYGYSSSGAVINYEDSASSTYVSWGGGVPQYSSLSSTAIANIVGGRGYVYG